MMKRFSGRKRDRDSGGKKKKVEVAEKDQSSVEIKRPNFHFNLLDRFKEEKERDVTSTVRRRTGRSSSLRASTSARERPGLQGEMTG